MTESKRPTAPKAVAAAAGKKGGGGIMAETKHRAGIIGLGIMGGRMAANLARGIRGSMAPAPGTPIHGLAPTPWPKPRG